MGTQLPPKGAQPPFSAHVYCGQTVPHLSYCWTLVLSEITKDATRILVCIIAVSKSQEFLLKVCRLFICFRWRRRRFHVDALLFFLTTTQGIRLRRRVNVFPRRRTLVHVEHKWQLYPCNHLATILQPHRQTDRQTDNGLIALHRANCFTDGRP